MELESRLTINAESDSDANIETVIEPGDKTAQQKANIFSKLTFCWINEMFKIGYKRTLQIEDVNYLPKDCQAHNTSKTFNKYWMKQLYPNILDDINTNNNILEEPLMIEAETDKPIKSHEHKLLRALLGAFGKPLLTVVPLQLLYEASPFIKIALISAYLSDAETISNSYEFMKKALLYSILMFLHNMLSSILGQQLWLKYEITAMNAKSSLTCACYDKIFKLTNSSRQETTSGAIMTLVTVDVDKISWIFDQIGDLFNAPFQLIICICLLYKCIGWSIFIALLIQIITIAPIKAYTVKKAKTYQRDIMTTRDNRMKIINEVCKAIKVIKMYGWINSFIDKITFVRTNEVQIFKYLQILYKSMWFFWELVPIMLAVISLSIYTSFDGILTVQKAFVSLMLFYELREPVQRIPGIILGLIDANVSLKRLETFLCAKEINKNIIQYYQNISSIDNLPIISCSNSSFSWDDKGDIMALKDFDIKFEKNTITIIVGETGSGKSALLNCLLGNLNKMNGLIYYNNKNISIGYSSQIAWITNATIRENILFGNKYNEQLYNKVIQMCALTDDLKILIAGDQTEIGEKGINLSGGQKARLSLARAVYNNADVYIFDDPISAVDSNVANHIFINCIKNYLLKQNKTIILATHAISFLKYADNIIVMDKGNIKFQGTFKDLMNDKNINLTKFIVNNNKNSDDSKDDDNEQKYDIKDNEEQINEEKTDGKLIDDEEHNSGHVSFDIYKLYAKASYGKCLFILFLLISLFYLVLENIFDVWWLGYWSNSIKNDGNAAHSSWWYLFTYIGLRFGALILLAIQIIIEIYSRLKAAKYFHKILLLKILNAPMQFFDTTPIGRIISRLSKDIDMIDNSLNESFKDSLRSTWSILTCIISVCIVIPYLLVVMIPLYILYYFLQKYFISTSRELKRLKSILNAPIYSNFSETISGTKIINSFKKTSDFMLKNENNINANQQARYAAFCGYRWYSIRLDFISNCLVLIAAIWCAIIRPTSGYIGIVLIMTQHITGSLNWFVNRISQLEQDIVSVERINQYSTKTFEQEKETIKTPIIINNINNQINMDIWPDKGIIEFKDVHMKYRNELPNVLNGLTFSVKSGEKIGIIGRTGAGKSTIFVTLLRLVEIENGIICIDNINISTIPLNILRSRISIIPQDPILFSGNIRFNLDPFNPTTLTLKNFIQKYNKSTKNSIHLYKTLTKIGIKTVDELHNKSDLDDIENKNDKNEIDGLKQYLNDCDNKLIEALKVSHCYEFLLENNSNNEIENVLDMKVDENGSNFSVGERQLICLSRAIIRKSSILLLDEATSSVDSQTDKLIQETIRNVFCNKTILTIAHRIDTILDYDRILILDKGGKVLQYDSPTNLLNDEKSKFSQIVQESFGIDINHIKSYLKKDITDTNINLKICSTLSKDSIVSCV